MGSFKILVIINIRQQVFTTENRFKYIFISEDFYYFLFFVHNGSSSKWWVFIIRKAPIKEFVSLIVISGVVITSCDCNNNVTSFLSDVIYYLSFRNYANRRLGSFTTLTLPILLFFIIWHIWNNGGVDWTISKSLVI